MKKILIKQEGWLRKPHYDFFSKFEEPFFGITVSVDCTQAYRVAKEVKSSFFLYYLYRALKAANQIENFKYRIVDGQVFLFDSINASPTINRDNGTFGFAYLNYNEIEKIFVENANREIDMVRTTNNLLPAISGQNVIHFSAIPWLDFTAVSHARSFSYPDSCPKILFGRVSESDGIRKMPLSVSVHHGLMDAYHVGLFVERFQELLNEY